MRVARPSVPPCTVTCSRKTFRSPDLEPRRARPCGAWPAAPRRRRRRDGPRCRGPSDVGPRTTACGVKDAPVAPGRRPPRRWRRARRRRPPRARRAGRRRRVGCNLGASTHPSISRRGRRRSRAARRSRTASRRPSLALELPHVRAVVKDGDLEIEPVARRDRAAELRLVDAEEVHERARRVEGLARVGEDAADLRERLEDEHPRHDGPRREVPLEPGLAHGHALVADDALARHDVRHAVDQDERPPVRQDLQDAVDLDASVGRFHASSASAGSRHRAR